MREVICDVLVIGAGAAGARAVFAAQQHPGIHVALAVKGKLGKSGASTFWVTEAAGYGAADGRRNTSDNPNTHYQDILLAARGMCDADVARTLTEHAPDSVRELTKYGVTFERQDGDYLITQGCYASTPRNYNLRRHGSQIVDALYRHFDTDRLTMLEDTMIVKLIVRSGRCVGAVGVTSEGEYIVINAKATVLTSGGAGQLFRFALNPNEITGDSYALGYEAGAELMNMEFMQTGCGILHPRFLILNSWIWSLYPKLTDMLGESVIAPVLPKGVTEKQIMDAKSTHYPFGSRTLSRYLEIGMQKAIAAGRVGPNGGVFLDARDAFTAGHSSGLQLFDDMWRLTNNWYLSQGIDVANQVIEVACFAHAINGGLRIDSNAYTNVPALFAAGEAASGPHGADRLGGNMLPACVVFGSIAGKEAAELAMRTEQPVFTSFMPESFVSSVDGPKGTELIARLQRLMFDNLMVVRSAEKCARLKSELAALKVQADNACFEDASPWMPYNLRNMLLVAGMMLEAVERRKESRGSHFREDFPHEEPAYALPFAFSKHTLTV